MQDDEKGKEKDEEEEEEEAVGDCLNVSRRRVDSRIRVSQSVPMHLRRDALAVCLGILRYMPRHPSMHA